MGGDARKAFEFENVSSHTLVHYNFSFFIKFEKKLKALSPTRERKRDRSIKLLVSY